MPDRPVITRSKDGFSLHLRKEERQLVGRLLGELAGLLTDPDTDPQLTHRLFPVVHPDDPEAEAEYQRLMREELVTSRVAAVRSVQDVLDRGGRSVTVSEMELGALMRGINAVRLVLGTLLGVSDDDEDALGFDDDDSDSDSKRDSPADDGDDGDTPEHHLYGYLSWLLDAAVLAQRD